MKNMSFQVTINQVRNRTKTVTRRIGWWSLKVGDIIMAVEKSMGLKKGEKIKRICPIRIVKVGPEPLKSITKDDCILEGFPELKPVEFIEMFCKKMKVAPDKVVNRIEFEYIEIEEKEAI